MAELESAALSSQELEDTLVRRLAQRLEGAFSSRLGPVLRLAMPFLMLAAVFVPLREALTEVSWQVRVRSGLQQLVHHLPRDVVESTVVVERHSVFVRVVVVGESDEGVELQRRLAADALALSGVVPVVDVLVLPDAAAVSALRASVRAAATAPPLPPATRAPLDSLAAVRLEWPSSAGELLQLTFEVRDGRIVARAWYLGPELGAPALELLSRELSLAAGTAVSLVVSRIAPGVVIAEGDGTRWLRHVASTLARTEALTGLQLCVTEPELPSAADTGDAPDPDAGSAVGPSLADPSVAAALRELLDGRNDVHVRAGPSYSIEVRTSPCELGSDDPVGPPTGAPEDASTVAMPGAE